MGKADRSNRDGTGSPRGTKLLIGGVIAAAMVAAAVAVAAEARSNVDGLLKTRSAPAQHLPPIVARVGTSTLSADQFARGVALAKDSGMTDAQAQKDVIDAFVRVSALEERAKAEGIVVSAGEVSAYVKTERITAASAARSSPELEARQKAAYAAYGSANADAYYSDPKVIATFRQQLLIGKLFRAHLTAGSTPQQVDRFVADTIATADIHVYIPLSTGGATPSPATKPVK